MKALILGSHGRAGRHIGGELAKRGWESVPFDRKTDDLNAKAKDADVIVFGWNPPYPKWAKDYVKITKDVIRAAERSGATIFFPGNVYVYGRTPSPWRVNTPHHAVNSLGEIRVEVERLLRASNAQTIILRAGDFIDDRPSGNWFDAIMTAKLDKGRFVYPGALNAQHAWAFLPDYAKAAAELIEARTSFGTHKEEMFAGYTLTGEELGCAIQEIFPNVRTVPMNWTSLFAIAPFWPMGRKIIEMRYLWNTPHSLQSDDPQEVTPLNQALRIALGQDHAQS